MQQNNYKMSCSSPTKISEKKFSLAKNIKLRLKSKYIPDDFFPESISMISGRQSKHQLGSIFLSPVKKISCIQKNYNEKQDQSEQSKEIALLKRFIKIKEKSGLLSEEEKSNKKCNQKQIMKKTLKQKQKIQLRHQNEIKKNQKRNSKKLMQYMQKMKNFINIDLNIQEDKLNQKKIKETKQIEEDKNTLDNVQTDDSPKITRERPKSEINSRDRLVNRLKLVEKYDKSVTRPIKIKVKDINKIMRSSRQSKQKDGRYNKFIDIPLDEAGLLTFYGSPDNRSKNSQSKSLRTSLPKLKK